MVRALVLIGLFTLMLAKSQAEYNVIELHLIIENRGIYLLSPVVQSPLEVQVRSPQESRRLLFSYESILSLEAAFSSPPQGAENIEWFYDGRWFVKRNGFWEQQELELKAATPTEVGWLKAQLDKLFKPPLELVDFPQQPALPPLRYDPEPGAIVYSTVWIRPAEAASLELPRLLGIIPVKLGGLRPRGGWLGSPAEVEHLWREFGLSNPPKTNPSSAVGFYFSGLRNESFRAKVLDMKLEAEALQAVLELESSEARSPEMTGVLLVFETPRRATLQVADSKGNILGTYR
ncbi:MAG: hypothetical protein RQ868_01815 [Meiothermus sp.]|uniref:hypothetical protein n=1 Tax=Meiothermus sp. TaxID=1955249 RepID=UPI0028CBDDC4|nr:hypothetical protein [Meiothermus sp.]MDT7919310.1 hypothetical protein [Meiothermus sp.]